MELLQLQEGVWGLLLPLLVILPLLALGLYCCYLQHIHLKYDHIPGAPRDSFFFGHLPIIWRLDKRKESIYDLFLRWSEEYGPIIRMNAFHGVVLVVLSPEGVKEFMMSPEYPKDPHACKHLFNLFGVRFLGNGLVNDFNHDHWQKQRKIMDTAFNRTFLMGLMGNFNDKAEELMEILEEKADGETEVDLMSLLQRVTLDIIGKVAFGMEINSLHDDQVPFPRAVSVIMKGLKESQKPYFKYLPWNWKEVKEVRESLKLLRRVGKECIERRRKAIQDGEEVPQDILTKILKTAEEEKNHEDENMLDNFVTFFFAGHETTSNQLSFAIMELGRQPEIVTRSPCTFGDRHMTTETSLDSRGRVRQDQVVLKEVLRLYPPAPGAVRWTRKEKIIGGVRIPAKTSLMFSTYPMGRSEKYFRDALTFNPDRFSKEQQKPYFSYFPFALGPRSCIGQVFSQMEAKVVMAKFLQRFEFELVPPQSFRILDTGTLRPLDGVTCKLRPRHQSG